MSQTILVPVDGSAYSSKALDLAGDLAQRLNARLVVMSVVDIGRAASMTFGEAQLAQACIDEVRSETQAVLQRALDRVVQRVPGVQSRLVEGNVVEQILHCASETGADWIVMGSHGRTGISHLLMGSVAEGVLHGSSIPVLVVPPDRSHRKPAKHVAGAQPAATP